MEVKNKKFIFVLDNIRSAFNIGAIFRVADGLLFDIHLIGITPIPSDFKIKSKLYKTSLNAIDHVVWRYFNNVENWYESIKIESSFIILSIENKPHLNNSISLFDIKKLSNVLANKEKIYICLGHEINGISDFIISKSEYVIYLPMEGVKTSLNVSTCAGIIGYFIKYMFYNCSK